MSGTRELKRELTEIRDAAEVAQRRRDWWFAHSADRGAVAMGCGGSKSDAEPNGFTAAGPAPAPAEDAAIVDQIAEELKKAKSASRMSVATEGAAQQLFRDYRRRSETARRSDSSSGSGSAGSPERIDRKGLRRMLSTVPDGQFDFLWPLFDAKGTGLVEPDEFVMTLGMLKDPNMSTERRVEVCFFMFDTNKTGTLSREEFRAMIQATVNVNLYDLLQTKTGEEGFEKHLQSEYSQENLAFYKAVQAFAKNAAAGDGDAAKAAKDIVQKYVKEGAEEQVNLPGPTTKRCLEKVAAVEAAGGGGAAWADVFKEAEAEIFKLMERDTCAARPSNRPHGVCATPAPPPPLTPLTLPSQVQALPPRPEGGRRARRRILHAGRHLGRRRRHLLRVPRVGAVAAVGLPILPQA